MEASVLCIKEGFPAQGQLLMPVVQGVHAAYLAGSRTWQHCPHCTVEARQSVAVSVPEGRS